MVLKLYGYSISTCTRFVALICKEKEIPYELVSVDILKGEQRNPEFVQHQPFGQVPYIDDDGFILYESRAVARYLIKKYHSQGTPGLIPTDLREEASFEQAASVEAFNWNGTIAPYVYEKLFTSAFGGQTDEERVKEFLAKFEVKLDVYDRILAKQKYMAGENVTLADLQHLPYASTLISAGHGDVIKNRPNVWRWWNEIYHRPSWQAVKDGA